MIPQNNQDMEYLITEKRILGAFENFCIHSDEEYIKYKNFMDSYRPISFRKKQTKREELDALVTDIRLLEKESRLFLGEFEKVSNYYPVTDQFKREEEFCRDLCSKTYSWKEDCIEQQKILEQQKIATRRAYIFAFICFLIAFLAHMNQGR